MCIFLTGLSLPPVQAALNLGPSALVLYVHEERLPPASLTLVAPVGRSLLALEFGNSIVIDNKVRDGKASDSKYLGRQLGAVVVGSDNSSFYSSFVYQLNTPAYEGSLTLAGIVQTGQMVVTGGTGSFSFVRGIAFVETVYNSLTEGVYKYSLQLKY